MMANGMLSEHVCTKLGIRLIDTQRHYFHRDHQGSDCGYEEVVSGKNLRRAEKERGRSRHMMLEAANDLPVSLWLLDQDSNRHPLC
jgi:hypothetical protein